MDSGSGRVGAAQHASCRAGCMHRCWNTLENLDLVCKGKRNGPRTTVASNGDWQVSVPLPIPYDACRVTLPIPNASRGVPVTATDRSNSPPPRSALSARTSSPRPRRSRSPHRSRQAPPPCSRPPGTPQRPRSSTEPTSAARPSPSPPRESSPRPATSKSARPGADPRRVRVRRNHRAAEHQDGAATRRAALRDGGVTAFIPDPEPDPDNAGTSAAEGVAVDRHGNVCGAEVGPRRLRRYEKR